MVLHHVAMVAELCPLTLLPHHVPPTRGMQERLKEMEEREELDKLDEQPDVPSADMM